MKKKIVLLLCTFWLGFNLNAQERKKKIGSMQELIKVARESSTTAKIASSIKENKYFQLINFKAGLRPQLSLNGDLLGYSKDYFQVIQPDGSSIFQPRTQNLSTVGLSLSQPITLTGGTLAVNSFLSRFDDLDRSIKSYSGIPINLSLSQPIFAFNAFKWQKKIEPLKYLEAEKEYIKSLEDISLQVSKLYFDVLDAQADLLLSKKNLASQKAIIDIENKRINLGTTSKDKILQLRLQLLKSTQEQSRAEVNLKTSLFNLKSFAGMSNREIDSLSLPLNLPTVNISIDQAIEAARKNRAEFVGYERRKLEAERDLQEAKRDRFKINVVTAFGYSNTGRNFNSVYIHPNSQQSLSLGIQMPILDWGRNKGRASIASANLKTVTYTLEQEEIIFLQQITALVENLRLISSNIDISRQADEIANERFDLASELFGYGKISITDLNIALSEKDAAKRAFINALRAFWESYYQLRLFTLTEV